MCEVFDSFNKSLYVNVWWLFAGTESSDFLLVTVESLNINPELVFPLWWPHSEVDFTTAFPLQGDGGLPCLFHPQRSVEQRSWERLWESLSRERIVWLDMAVLRWVFGQECVWGGLYYQQTAFYLSKTTVFG